MLAKVFLSRNLCQSVLVLLRNLYFLFLLSLMYQLSRVYVRQMYPIVFLPSGEKDQPYGTRQGKEKCANWCSQCSMLDSQAWDFKEARFGQFWKKLAALA